MYDKPLHVFIGTVYPRFDDMHAERVQRLHEHYARICLLHEHLSEKHQVVITNPLNGKANRKSDRYPSINLRETLDDTDDEKAKLENSRRFEIIRRHLSFIRQANLAIIDLTYLEDRPEITALVNEADLLDIPMLLIRYGELTTGLQRSVANKHRFIACYTSDFELRIHVDDAIEMLFPYSRREDETNPQIPSKILTFQKKGS